MKCAERFCSKSGSCRTLPEWEAVNVWSVHIGLTLGPPLDSVSELSATPRVSHAWSLRYISKISFKRDVLLFRASSDLNRGLGFGSRFARSVKFIPDCGVPKKNTPIRLYVKAEIEGHEILGEWNWNLCPLAFCNPYAREGRHLEYNPVNYNRPHLLSCRCIWCQWRIITVNAESYFCLNRAP